MSSSRGRVARRASTHPVALSAILAAMILAAMATVGAGWNPFAASGAPTGTGFAQAAPGSYLVVAATEPNGSEDIISVVPAHDPGSPIEIARVQHLAGYPSSGSVSPDGTKAALIVADAGTLAAPGATVIVVDLLSGDQTRIAIAADVLQDPVWTPDSAAVLFKRTIVDDDSGIADVAFHRAPLDLSGESVVATASNVLGAFAVGFQPGGELVWVSIGAGSLAHVGSRAVTSLSAGITRDWSLSPDGTQLAFIEVLVEDGVRYEPRLASLLPGQGVSAQAVSDRQAAGTSWRPGATQPTFGLEPGVGAQSDSAVGFDVPLEWAPTGEALAAQSWSGASFDEPGIPSLTVITDAGRVSLDGRLQFYGWAQR